MLAFLKENILSIISIFVALVGIVVPVYKYLIGKSTREAELRFKTYHNLIKKLVQPELLQENVIQCEDIQSLKCAINNLVPRNIYGIMIDRQIGIVFELRNYPEYFEVTKRILTDLKSNWQNNTANERVLREIEYTLSYINTYMKTVFQILRCLGFKQFTVFLSSVITRKNQNKPQTIPNNI